MGSKEAAVSAMSQLIKQLNETLSNNEQYCQQLVTTYEQIGDVWADEKYSEMGEAIVEIVTALCAPRDRITDSAAKLQRLQAALEEYLSTH